MLKQIGRTFIVKSTSILKKERSNALIFKVIEFNKVECLVEDELYSHFKILSIKKYLFVPRVSSTICFYMFRSFRPSSRHSSIGKLVSKLLTNIGKLITTLVANTKH